ncbi:MAG: hypothetical protein ABI333_16285 [bacterium]
MKRLLDRLLRRTRRESPSRTISPVHDVGFHGDRFLLELTHALLAQSTAFVETGTNVGSTAHYVATRHPHLMVYSGEPDEAAFRTAKETTARDPNVVLYNMLSPEFLVQLHRDTPSLRSSLNFYWLDAHDYGFEWPLHDEIRYLTETLDRAIILVDDARVPTQPDRFKYCSYNGVDCDIAYVENALAPAREYQLFYPAYTEHTSAHHPLVGTLGILHGDLALEEDVFAHFERVGVNKP